MGVLRSKVKGSDLDLSQFQRYKTQLEGLPDLRLLERAEDQALWCLWYSKDKVSAPYLSAAEISLVLADVFEVSLQEPAIRMALSRAGAKVHSRKLGQVSKFSIMAAGKDSLSGRVFVIDPSKPHSAIKMVAELLGSLSSLAKICDPYLDGKTLQVLEMIPDSCTIQFLSLPPKNPAAAFTRLYSSYKSQHGNLEIRTVAPGQIHDRYILTAQDMWVIGHSLNAIGTKQTFVVTVGGDIRKEIEAWFNRQWMTAQIL